MTQCEMNLHVPHALLNARSVQYLISTVDPEQIWGFLHTEMPIRYAERIRSLEHVPQQKRDRKI